MSLGLQEMNTGAEPPWGPQRTSLRGIRENLAVELGQSDFIQHG